jgi:hypothetical protein
MARPIKNNADYFTHDSQMRNHRKIKALRYKFGLIGYAVYNMLLEVLTNAENFQFEWDELEAELLAGDFNIDIIELHNIIDYLTSLKLVEIENGYMYSTNLIQRFELLIAKRERNRQAVQTYREAITEVAKEPDKFNIKNYPEIAQNLKAFIEMRKKIKKPITDYALKLLISKLQKLSNDKDLQNRILEQSIMNNWQGVFELKTGVRNERNKSLDDIAKSRAEYFQAQKQN